ncbi:MAG: DUF4838 domain-containing protein [Lentisphaeria bacterium]|nr:DUF4838 domain-containing protein [Lentisphaeria bacterium]
MCRIFIVFTSVVLLALSAAADVAQSAAETLKMINAADLTPVSVKTGNGAVADDLSVIVLPENDVKAFQQMVYVADQERYQKYYQRPVSAIAADQLQLFWEKVTGKKLEIVKALPEGKKGFIMQFDETLPAEGFRIECKDGNVFISGAVQGKECFADSFYSLIFAVNDILERFCGIRFYYPGDDGVYVPAGKRQIVIPAMSYQDAPLFSKRQLSGVYENRWKDGGTPPDHTIHMLRLRNGGSGYLGANRTFYHTPADLAANPKTVKEVSQNDRKPQMPCYSAPATLEAYLEAVDNYYAKRGDNNEWRYLKKTILMPPEAKIIPFSPLDYPIDCRCGKCAALRDDKAPFHAQASRVYADFIKRAAQAVKERYPDKTFYILPYYNYVECPAGLELPDNVAAQVCLMYGHSLWNDAKIREWTLNWIRSWSRATGKKVYLYSYPMWPDMEVKMPALYFRNLPAFVKDTADISSGLRMDSLHDWSKEFFNHYCHYKLMWNKDFNVEEALKGMCRNLYGKAGKSMYDLYDLVGNIFIRINSSNNPAILDIGPYRCGTIRRKGLYENLIGKKEITAIEKFIADARSAAGENTLERRRVEFFAKTFDEFLRDWKFTSKGSKINELKLPVISGAVKIDGVLDEPFWKDIPESSFVMALPSHVPTPEEQTKFRIARRGNALVLGFRMEESQMAKIETANPVWGGDVLELFIEFAPGRVYHIGINAKGQVTDHYAMGAGPAKRSGAPNWSCRKNADNWVMEMYLPLSFFGTDIDWSKVQYIRANFCRGRKVSGVPHLWTRWQTQFTGDNLNREAFGKLILK